MLGGNMNRNSRLQPIFIIIVLSFLLVSLTGCATPTPAPTQALPTPVSLPSLSVLNLPDGSLIVLKSFSEIKIGSGDTLIKSGEALVVSVLPAGTWFTVVNPRGYIGQVTADPAKPGAIMLVTYDEVSGKFTVVCIQGFCVMGPDADHLTKLPYSSQASLDLTGKLEGPAALDLAKIIEIYGKYIQIGLFAPTAVASTPAPTTPAETPTSTPDIGATATAACADFHSKFALTPCP
jgi:hypothetical protein